MRCARTSVRTDVAGGYALLTEGAVLGDDRPAVLAVGAFDGLHLGHRALVDAAISDAHAKGVACLAVTFDPDPSEVLFPSSAERRLLATDDRVEGLLALGVDGVVVLEFTTTLASLSPRRFVGEVLCACCDPVAIHVGSNFRFGAGGAGDVCLLRELGRELGFEVRESALLMAGGDRVSSTRVRNLLALPDMLDEANELLGRAHFLRGAVEHGRGEGTSFGFPTANVRFPRRSCMPAQGVYGGYAVMGDSAWPAAINVGAPPTFSGPDELFLEANLIGFEGDLYGREMAVVFVEWLRASRPFSSTDELERVVLGNIDWVRTNLGDGRVEVRA